MLTCRHCGKEVERDLSGDWIHANSHRPGCYISGDVEAEPSTDTWEGFKALYIDGTDRVFAGYELDMEQWASEHEHSPMIVVKHGPYRLVLNPMAFKDHLCVDVHAFVDEKDARTGIFGMDAAAKGSRIEFDADNVQGKSHGWPAASLIALLLGKQEEKP